MLRTIAIITIIFSSLFFSVPIVAAVDTSSKIPALNPFCWKRAECHAARANFLSGTPSRDELETGFVSNASVVPCFDGDDSGSDEEWGRCLPAGQTKTQISFGGEDKFSNIGEFIIVMYKYLIAIASVVAAIMITFAGVQWVASAGNTETISSAKHRIGGAVIGLFITYFSYFILNTINPALVNLRLPQVWLVRSQDSLPTFCHQVEGAASGTLKFFYLSDENNQTSFVDETKASKEELIYGKQKKDGKEVFYCGRRFLAENSGTQTCMGNLCPSEAGRRQICDNEEDSDLLACAAGELVIHYFIDVRTDILEQLYIAAEKANKGAFITSMMQTDWLKNNQAFWGVCDNNGLLYLANDGKEQEWSSSDKMVSRKRAEIEPYWEYTIRFSKLADWEGEGWRCGNGKLVGYFLRNETLIDESGWEKYGSVFLPVGLYRHFSEDKITEPNLNIGYDRQKEQPLYGNFSHDIAHLSFYETVLDLAQGSQKLFQNYIPIDKLKENGLRLNIRLTTGKIIEMRALGRENAGVFYTDKTEKAQQQLLDEQRAWEIKQQQLQETFKGFLQ